MLELRLCIYFKLAGPDRSDMRDLLVYRNESFWSVGLDLPELESRMC